MVAPRLQTVTVSAVFTKLGVAFVALVLCCSAAADADSASAPTVAATSAGFGTPPGGEVPILFDDHTVYATPDLLKRGRVLAALIKDGQIYVPLRSMFEQMGATVTASPDGQTISASKTGASVTVTVGKHEVVINGETRPLDVPPIVFEGVVLVPVRVLSEAMGAYVQWVPAQRVVVVRYFLPPPPTPAPPPPPPPAPPVIVPVATPAPSPVPTVAAAQRYPNFLQVSIGAPKDYNEFSAGQDCDSYLLNGAYAFGNSGLAVKVDYRQDAYVTSNNLVDTNGNHFTRFATIDGGTAFTPVFLARQSSLDGRLEYRVAEPRIYLGVAYLQTANNYGYPQLNGFGFGVEKLPDLRPGFSFTGSAFYFPVASGNYTVTNPASPNAGRAFQQQYQIVKFDVGLALVLGHSPVYLQGGFTGDHYTAKRNAPIGQTHDGPYVGLGVKF